MIEKETSHRENNLYKHNSTSLHSLIQLSELPGNNYVSACAGYLDGVFDSYVKQNDNNVPNRAVAFPENKVILPNPMVNDGVGRNDYDVDNEY